MENYPLTSPDEKEEMQENEEKKEEIEEGKKKEFILHKFFGKKGKGEIPK